MKLISTIVTLLLCSFSFAQSFSVQTLDTTLQGAFDEYTFYGDIDITNTGNSTINITWKNIEQSIPNGWEVSNCDPTDCYEVGDLTGSFDLTTNVPGMINTHFYPNNLAGNGFVKIKVYPTNTPADSVILTFHGNATTTDVNKVTPAPQFGVYPNPASNSVSILGSHLQDRTIQIFDALGRKIMTTSAGSNNINLDIEDLKPGVYLVKIDKVARRFVKR